MLVFTSDTWVTQCCDYKTSNITDPNFKFWSWMWTLRGWWSLVSVSLKWVAFEAPECSFLFTRKPFAVMKFKPGIESSIFQFWLRRLENFKRSQPISFWGTYLFLEFCHCSSYCCVTCATNELCSGSWDTQPCPNHPKTQPPRKSKLPRHPAMPAIHSAISQLTR